MKRFLTSLATVLVLTRSLTAYSYDSPDFPTPEDWAREFQSLGVKFATAYQNYSIDKSDRFQVELQEYYRDYWILRRQLLGQLNQFLDSTAPDFYGGLQHNENLRQFLSKRGGVPQTLEDFQSLEIHEARSFSRIIDRDARRELTQVSAVLALVPPIILGLGIIAYNKVTNGYFYPSLLWGIPIAASTFILARKFLVPSKAHIQSAKDQLAIIQDFSVTELQFRKAIVDAGVEPPKDLQSVFDFSGRLIPSAKYDPDKIKDLRPIFHLSTSSSLQGSNWPERRLIQLVHRLSHDADFHNTELGRFLAKATSPVEIRVSIHNPYIEGSEYLAVFSWYDADNLVSHQYEFVYRDPAPEITREVEQKAHRLLKMTSAGASEENCRVSISRLARHPHY